MDTTGQSLLQKKLHKKIKSGIGLSVANLPFTSQTEAKRIQSAVAVAGADTSITILTCEHGLEPEYRDLEINSHLFLPSVHPTSITSLAFSTYDPPTTVQVQPQPQFLKLASTSIANTVVVHTFPLQPYSPKKKSTKPVPSFVLSKPGSSRTLNENVVSVLVGLLAISVGMFFLQVFTEAKSPTPGPLGVKNWLDESWQARLSGLTMSHITKSTVEYVYGKIEPKSTPLHKAEEKAGDVYNEAMNMHPNTGPTDPSESSNPQTSLRTLLHQHASANPDSSSPNNPDSKPLFSDDHAILISNTQAPSTSENEDDPQPLLSAELYHPDRIAEKHGSMAKKWEDLLEHERLAWKLRLIEAGEWAIEEGESVLKGVFFSGLAQGVGRAVAGE